MENLGFTRFPKMKFIKIMCDDELSNYGHGDLGIAVMLNINLELKD
jgi:hypothetical protein